MTENQSEIEPSTRQALISKRMPAVTIIVPCYNEQGTISLLLVAISRQSYPQQDMEVVIADGLSTDRTREEIGYFREQHPEMNIRIVDNPKRTIPAGLNCGLRAAQGEYVVRLDAHSMPRPDYVELCVEDLQANLGDNVGGVWDIQPLGESPQAQAIAWAAAQPLAVGDARYRFSNRAQLTDTVPFGSYLRSLIDRVGMYNETLLTNEDYEFNFRIRQSGGKIWLDPRIRSVYFARPTLHALFKQYWRYGFWKAQMLRANPTTLRWRQFLPPAFVAYIFLSIVIGFWLPAVWNILGLVLLLYVLLLGAIGLKAAWKEKDIAMVLLVPLAIATMHISWGSAFLWGLPHKMAGKA